ncbi:hypothetical protein HNP81_003482 [Peribacillus huizhouensis]|uniref:DUF1657 domain-containing protein n=1 Tax=Peribacillus huizhouensis TaxID=1501239 RepID=A0ABR6CT03_9BACI|nr:MULTISPECIES: DUF1657 domain-containing protein [Bacillaceae]MBA9028162.1 hypothetical protein [Peribacillus huizhouensis]
MTIGSEVKQCLASLKGIESNLSSLEIRTPDEESKRIFHETMVIVNGVVADLQQRVIELEVEETQYKGF